jgi:hypothetical protein
MNNSEKNFEKNLYRCRRFYEDFGATMIHDKFPEYENRIAVGFCGEGSDCFGYDDYISTDHDYTTGFTMWLTDEDYELFGDRLGQEYITLIRSLDLVDESLIMYENGRRGVMRIADFFSTILGVRRDEFTKSDVEFSYGFWLSVNEDKLATATNGVIYRDDLGRFSGIYNKLRGYYPEKVWKMKVAEQLYHFSQNAQSNYARAMARQDVVTARLCISQGIDSAMKLAYLLNKTYSPYYKWRRRGMDDLATMSQLGTMLDEIAMLEIQTAAWDNRAYNPYEINTEDKVIAKFEQVAEFILEYLNKSGLVSGKNPFLDIYSKLIMASI